MNWWRLAIFIAGISILLMGFGIEHTVGTRADILCMEKDG